MIFGGGLGFGGTSGEGVSGGSGFSPLFTNSVSANILQFSGINQAERLFYGSPLNSTGLPTFRSVTGLDVEYSVPYTGGITETVSAKLKQSVSVLDFGAVGDGVTNDTVAIQAALNSGAKSIYFPTPNVSYFCGTLIIPAGVLLYGDGYGSVITQGVAPSSSQGLFYVNSGSSSTQVSDIQIYNLGLVGKSVASGLSQFVHLISFNGVNDVAISGCYIAGFQGDGIYLGSGDISGEERHNTNINILNNLIDGLNNENRNGTSIIDGTNILIDGNTYQNCTADTMPGAIDIEPDDNAFYVIKDIRITNNNFSNVTGNVGAITCALANDTYTTAPSDILISGNTFNVPATTFVVAECNDYATQGLNLNVINNSGQCAQGFQILGQTNGLKITNNNFDQTDNSFLGFNPSTDLIQHCLISDNKFYGPGGSVGAISAINCTYTTIKNNIYNHFSYGVTIGNSSSTISYLSIGPDIYINTANANIYNGGANLSTCQYLGAIGTAVNNFPAFITTDCGLVTNSGTASSFNSATLPDSFSIGTSTAIINGDTGVPVVDGDYQGTLINYKYTGTSGYEKYQYQMYFPANNGTTLSQIYIRQATGSNTWSAFTLINNQQKGVVAWADNSGATLSLTVNYNYYRIVDGVVFVTGQITYPSTASGANASLSGLPVACVSSFAPLGIVVTGSTGITTIAAGANNAATTVSLYNELGTPITNADLSGATLYINGSYLI